MNVCKICKKELNGDYKFCPHCGASLTTGEVASMGASADVERIKSIMPMLKSALSGASIEQAEMLSKISEQQRVIDNTLKELNELKEVIKQNALATINNQQAGQNQGQGQTPYGMYPFPYYYPYPMYPGMMAGVMPNDMAYQQQNMQSAPVDPIKDQTGYATAQNVEEAQVVESDMQNAIDVDPVNTKDSAPIEKPKKEKKKGVKRARILSFIILILGLAGIALPFVLNMFTFVSETAGAKICNGMNVIDALVYAFTNTNGAPIAIMTEINPLRVEFITAISTEFNIIHVAYWAFVGGFALTLLITFINVLFGFVRIASGKTKGRIYFLDFLAVFTYILSVAGLIYVIGTTTTVTDPTLCMFDEIGIVESAKWVITNAMHIGYYALGAALVLRIFFALFIKRTRIKKKKAKKH